MRDSAVRWHHKEICIACGVVCPWLYINTHGTITGVECPVCGHQWLIDTKFGKIHTRPSNLYELGEWPDHG